MTETDNTQNTPAVSGPSDQATGGGSLPPTPEQPKAGTERINVGDMSQEDPNMLEVNWGDDKGDDLLKGKTKQVPPITSAQRPSGQASSGSVPGNKEKFKFGIQVLVMVIDFALSNILAKIAGNGDKASQYTADPKGKENFEEALCMLLETKQDLMPTWLIVLLAFASAWGFQVMAAIQSKIQQGKPGVEKKGNASDPVKPGLFIGIDGKVYRRYQNGSVRPAQFNTDGTEKVIGQPARRRAAA